ncbi:MAG TPA: hypothetical protein VHW01_25355 [Polyangiaceae bacterium]|jgi:hypothetical protein|nr:hypothetical protein [Polyangiaceae bacterium]
MSKTHSVQVSDPVAPPVAPPAPAPSPFDDPTALNLRQAYDKTLATAQALDEDELLPVNVDLRDAVNTAVGKLPQILALRQQVQAELPKFDSSQFDVLEQYALAAGHAHTRYLAASAPASALADLNARGIQLRDILYNDAVALAARNLIPSDRIGSFKSNIGYKNLTYDLLGLVELLRENWGNISNRTGVQPSELDEAEALGGKLISVLSAREQAPAVAQDVSTQRQRNFTLFAKTYDQIRRALTYLRWNEDDVENIAPSLYGGRTVSRKKDDATPPAPSPAPTPAPAPVSNGGNAAPSPVASGNAPATPATPASNSPFAHLS